MMHFGNLPDLWRTLFNYDIGLRGRMNIRVKEVVDLVAATGTDMGRMRVVYNPTGGI